jgi:predicted unusual protein kinase regulating ubiquinone biosynthesis (AarF/ABC1/UbiB family)
MAKKPPRGKVGRLARLGGLTSRVSGSYIGQRIRGAFQDEETRSQAMRRLHLDNAERVVSTMGSLKGAAMKVGQSLAQVVDGLDLPEEIAGILGQLNDKAEPIPFPVIRDAVEAELEGSITKLFSGFDEEPLGTASLAQAHAARLPDGTPVVIKVLHQGIENSVDSDLAALKSILLTGRLLRRDRKEVDEVFSEVRARLQEELDYYQEAANLEQFHASMAHIDGVTIPKTHPRYSTQRVLTMDRLTGRSMADFLKTATPEAKQRAGDLLTISFHDMFYRQRALHADPHGGNYLFRPDGGVGILDFGCVKRFDVYWVGHYAQMARALIHRDQETFLSKAREIAILGDGSAESEQLLWTFGQTICSPLQQEQFTCGIGEQDVMREVRKMVPQILRHPNLRSPGELVYLHRSLGGIYAMLRDLRHTHRYNATCLAYTGHAIQVAEGRVPDGKLVTV